MRRTLLNTTPARYSQLACRFSVATQTRPIACVSKKMPRFLIVQTHRVLFEFLVAKKQKALTRGRAGIFDGSFPLQ